MSDEESKGGCGCGCFSFILMLFTIWALFFGVSTPWGKFNIDIFPPRIWDMNEVSEDDPVKVLEFSEKNSEWK